MGPFQGVLILLAGTVVTAASIDQHTGVIGFGPGPELYEEANLNPLNQTGTRFAGFNYNADAGSTDNATSGDWYFHAKLSVINVDTNDTNYAISSAAQSASNVINVAYSVDFPALSGELVPAQLPEQNDTDWTMCVNIIEVPWTAAARGHVAVNAGNCFDVLGPSCWNSFYQGWKESTPNGLSTIGCPRGPSLSDFSACDSLSTNGQTGGSASISSFYSDPNNSSSPRVGLKAGQIYSYRTTQRFDGSAAEDTYHQELSRLRMQVLTFSPSEVYIRNHTGTLNPGEVRILCSVFDLSAARSSGSPLLRPHHVFGICLVFWTLFFATA